MNSKANFKSPSHNWFHLSDAWKDNQLLVHPRRNRIDDGDDSRDIREFIAVCPTIEQCVVALGAWFDYGLVRVYEAQAIEPPLPADWVFDFEVTGEHRFYQETVFSYVGDINIDDLVQAGSVRIRQTCGSANDGMMLKNISRTLVELKKVGITPKRP